MVWYGIVCMYVYLFRCPPRLTQNHGQLRHYPPAAIALGARGGLLEGEHPDFVSELAGKTNGNLEWF